MANSLLSRLFVSALRLAARAVLPTLLLEIGRCLWGAPFSAVGLLGRLLLTILLLVLALWTRPQRVSSSLFEWPHVLVFVIVAVLGSALWLAVPSANLSAWMLMVAIYEVLLGCDQILTQRSCWIRTWSIRAFLTLVAGTAIVALAEVESHFADEEFFVGLQALMLGLYWLIIRMVLPSRHHVSAGRALFGWRGNPRLLSMALCLAVFAGGAGLTRSYQRSFYTWTVPAYDGISSSAPFICGDIQAEPTQYVDGEEVFSHLMNMVALNPDRGTPEHGMLALGTEDEQWAEAFRAGLLEEAGENRFAGPAHSVKFQQYEAALRLYYFIRVREAFPDLFTEAELDLLQSWFSSVNDRALTVEWVDLMYALAFSKWPEGPYDNQEVGVAFLSLVEVGGMSSTELSQLNRAYLRDHLSGWLGRFRNTDDAFAYQPEWITNAYFQSLYTEAVPSQNVRHAFEWLLLQSLSDGEPLGYNHPGKLRLAGIYYLGAILLDDPRYLWLAEQSLQRLETLGLYPFAQPGVEKSIDDMGYAPDRGSCLIYGDSGLPNQRGPLAPDKVVFRDGWKVEDPYLLMNLRFSGWHRYKATASIPMIYWEGPLVTEAVESAPYWWLPEGRSLFRDKRIPRDSLNGVVVERTGFGALVQHLTGSGSTWAQDPPHYAEVLEFETGEDVDRVHVRVASWRGWRHDRWVYFYHDQGPIVVIDEAHGPANREASLVWHFPSEAEESMGRFLVRGGDKPVVAELVSLDTGTYTFQHDSYETYKLSAAKHGQLHLATVFLLSDWSAADVAVDPETQTLVITLPQSEHTLSLPSAASSDRSRD